MFFKQVSSKITMSRRDQVYLVKDKWDDWFKFETMYLLTYIDNSGVRHNIGEVKIGQFNMKNDQRVPDIPDSFDTLDKRFFSLGQDVSYYETLKELDEETRVRILIGLRDVAYNTDLLEEALGQEVMNSSLLRSVPLGTVRNQFHRVAHGDAKLTKYKFKYTSEITESGSPSLELQFRVIPESNPPTNIHALIGRNGVGKTRLLTNMIKSLLLDDEEAASEKYGVFSSEISRKNYLFSNLVSVAFSAFDETDPLAERKDDTEGIRYSYVGLKQHRNPDEESKPPKSLEMLNSEFVESAKICRVGAKYKLWMQAIEKLEADPLFKEAEILELAKLKKSFNSKATNVFRRLSSGHKIVLLTITKLVETVEERTLVLLDEPEIYLHPPLLSAFIRAISDLLIRRNGVAIISTHSPVVLQEVPKSCVSILRRVGAQSVVEKPEIETFGENIGSLTREVFGLEVTHSGFHQMLQEAIEELEDFDDIIDYFNDELGMEARAILRALLANRK